MKSQSPIDYFVMAGEVGSYGWASKDGRNDVLGPSYSESYFWGGKYPISEQLHRDFVTWQQEFANAEWMLDGAYLLSMDWEEYHRRGLELAQRLKCELGETVPVYYVKPMEDPNTYMQDHREILADGTIKDIPSNLPYDLQVRTWLPQRIVSGGQTGVDRAALDFACRHRIPHGGWCPKGRRANDGPIPMLYQLKETDTEGYSKRTRFNVRDSDATLILNEGVLAQGTLLTVRWCVALDRPHLVVQMENAEVSEIIAWLQAGQYKILNIAGPREEKCPGIYEKTMSLLEACFRAHHYRSRTLAQE